MTLNDRASYSGRNGPFREERDWAIGAGPSNSLLLPTVFTSKNDAIGAGHSLLDGNLHLAPWGALDGWGWAASLSTDVT